jgi:hypothetical protein
MKQFLYDRPWIWIALSFVMMLTALASVVVICERYKPQSIALEVSSH